MFAVAAIDANKAVTINKLCNLITFDACLICRD